MSSGSKARFEPVTIHHCVFFTFSDDIGQSDRDHILGSLAQLVEHVPGMVSLDFGPNADFERKSEIYQDGFVAVFEDREALARYANDPRHLALGQRLVDNCTNGGDGIIVFDIVSS